jgi:hypothetical protein
MPTNVWTCRFLSILATLTLCTRSFTDQTPAIDQCAFKESRIDTYDKLIPCYDIEPVKKITDAVSLRQSSRIDGY